MAKTDAKSKKKNKKKSNKSVSMKLKSKTTTTEPKQNPFESIWSRRKFDILGKKKGNGEERRMGLARSLAIDKRKKTLLKEYEQSGKSSVFLDKRIGEKNDQLGEFDKGIMRSQRERQLKVSKKSKYNLSDGEEDDFEIPSLGPLSEHDDFDNEMLSDDDRDPADETQATLKQFDGGETQKDILEGEEKRHKTKKEIMEEVMLKSKFFKAQKAKDKEENTQLMEELDKSFTSLVQSRALLSLTEPGKMNALKALVHKDLPDDFANKDSLSGSEKPEVDAEDQPDAYDKMLKSMVLDMRARPSERTKTPEELAQEEREKLEQLEEERQQRMLASNDSSDEENDDVKKQPAQKIRSVSGDDLGDSFSFHEEAEDKKGWVDEILERRNGEDSENECDDSSEDGDSDSNGVGSDDGDSNEDNEENKTLSLKDWEQSDDDNLDIDLEEDEEEHGNFDDDNEKMEPIGHKKSKKTTVEVREEKGESLDAKKTKQRSNEPDIPFLIDAPKSYEEFCALLDNCSNANVIVVVNRIRASNAIKLAAENRKKMQVFYGVLLQYFAVLANKKPLNFELLNLLVKPLIEMSMEIPYFSAICARQRILRTRSQFCESIKHPENGCWPSMKTLSLLRLWSMIFPCSDFRHVVMTPAILLMCEYLMRCPILSGCDIAVGSFLCSILLSVIKHSKKFCPEAIIFLRTLLLAAIKGKRKSCQESEFYHLVELKALGPLLCMQDCVNEISPLNFFMIMDLPDDSSFFSSDNFRASVLFTLTETLQGYVNIYEGLSAFPEIFLPISTLLLQVAEQKNMPAALKAKFKDVTELIKKKSDEHHVLRRPLQMRKQKPVPIKLLNPKFEDNFVKGRDYDPDRERAERKKLKKLVQKEAKGAARELRKDNYFLMEVKEKERALAEAERAEKYGRARAFLQEQESAFKSGQLGKGRKRRR